MLFLLSWLSSFPSPVEDWVCEKRGPRGAVCVSRLMSLKGLLWLISTGKMPAVPAPSGHEGGYLRHARTRHGASVRGYTRRRFRCRSMPLQWRHLRFTIQRRWSPKEDGRYDSTSFVICQSPARLFCRNSRIRSIAFQPTIS